MQADKLMRKPSIVLVVSTHAGCERKMREVQAGIEEEGIPYTTLLQPQGEAVELAYQGAQQSQLGVGVGVSSAGLCIHYHKLPFDQPLYLLTAAGNMADWRCLGYNAARLIKGIPFKTAQLEAQADEMSELAAYIRQIIYQVLQESGLGPGEVKV